MNDMIIVSTTNSRTLMITALLRVYILERLPNYHTSQWRALCQLFHELRNNASTTNGRVYKLKSMLHSNFDIRFNYTRVKKLLQKRRNSDRRTNILSVQRLARHVYSYMDGQAFQKAIGWDRVIPLITRIIITLTRGASNSTSVISPEFYFLITIYFFKNTAHRDAFNSSP